MTTAALTHRLIADVDAHLPEARAAWIAAPTYAQRSETMGILNQLLDYRLVLMAARDALGRSVVCGPSSVVL